MTFLALHPGLLLDSPPSNRPVQCTDHQKNKNLEFFLRLQKVFWKLRAATTVKNTLLSVCCMQISWWRLRSLVDAKKNHGNKETLTFPGDRNHALVPGLTPFSEYSLIVMTFNGRGNGPGSHPVNFKTPEGGKIVGKQHEVY